MSAGSKEFTNQPLVFSILLGMSITFYIAIAGSPLVSGQAKQWS